MRTNLQLKWAIAFIVLLAYGCKKESIRLPNASSNNNEIIKVSGGSYSRTARFDNEPVLRDAFYRYARYFGMTGTWSEQKREEFKQILIKYVLERKDITVLQGFYKNAPVTHYYNEFAKIDVITDRNSQKLIGIMQLNNYQSAFLLKWKLFY